MINIEGEWYIAYHGTGGNDIPKKIIEEGFKRGNLQIHEDYENDSLLSKQAYDKCGEGVYVT
jgi:hypothetical protein